MRERSPSPVSAQSKRQTPPTPASTLSTRYTPEEMDRAPELENKKHFLTMFNLNHVSQEQRIGVCASVLHTCTHLYPQYDEHFYHLCLSVL